MTKAVKVKLFKDSITKYIDFFSLHEWEIYFEEDDEKGTIASTRWHEMNGAQNVIFSWGKDWIEDKTTTKEEIYKASFHEVLELLLAKLRDFSSNTTKKISKREVDTEVHRVIRIMENKVFKLIKLKSNE